MTPKTTAVWASRVAAWRKSGQSADDFVRGKDYAASSLRNSATKLAELAGPAKPDRSAERRPEFVELVPVRGRDSSPAVVSPAEVVRRGGGTRAASGLTVVVRGAQITVEAGFDPVLLSEVVAALEVDR